MNSAMEESLFSLNHSTAPSPNRVEAYERLPDAIRAVYSEKEYLWLSAGEKANLEQRETEPECE